MYPVNQTWISRLEQLNRLSAYALVSIAVIVLFIRLLLPQTALAALLEMKALSAAGFVLCGLIVYLRKRTKPAAVLSTLLLALSSLVVLQYIFNVDLGLALLQNNPKPIYDDLMAFTTAVTLLLVSLNFLLVINRTVSTRTSQLLAAMVFFVAFTILLAQVYDITIQSEYNEWELMAPLSCVLLMLISLCQFSRYPEQDAFTFLLHDAPGLFVILKLFGMLLLFPIVFGSIISGFPEGVLPKEYELALFAISYTIFFSILLFRYSLALHHHSLEQHEQELLQEQLNEELMASNEELRSTNKKLAEAGERIQELTQQALQESENRYKQLTDSITDAFYAVDKQLLITFWNKACERIFGFSQNEVLGKHILEVFPRAKETRMLEDLQEVLQSHKQKNLSLTQDISGRQYHFEVRIYPTKHGLSVFRYDTSEIHRIRYELQLEKECLELILWGADLGTWDWHIPSDRVEFDERWAAMLGFRVDELQPHADTWQSLVHPDDMPVIMEHLPLHLEGKLDNFRVEYRMRTKAGGWKWLLDSARVIERDTEGKPLRMMGIHLDIDRLKKVEEELREQKNSLELALWAAELGTWERDFRSNAITVDNRSAQLLGYEREEFGQLLTWQMDKLFHPDDREEALQNVEKHLKGESPFYRQQHRTLCKNGEWKWVMNTGKVVERDAQGNPLRFVGVQQDISEIKKVESDLSFFKYFTDNSLNPAYAIDPVDNFRMVYVNEAACRHYGYSQEELLQMRIVDWDADFTEADSHVVLELLRREKFTIFETRHQRKDSSIVPVQVTASLTLFEGKEYFTGYIQDISERKAAEKKIRQANNRLESRVKERTAELEATNRELEAFSYSVSHDLRSPLRSIDGFSKALVEDYYELLDEDGKDFLQSIRNATARMGSLIDDMLKLSRISRAELKHQEVDISQMVRNILDELKMNNPERNVATHVPPGFKLQADPKLMSIALRNLLENAWKFTSKQNKPEISLGRTERDGRKVYFISDNGAGFDMEYAHKLFGAFQRLHHQDEFEGSGIGLATVQRIISRHGGRIWAEAEPGQGACFYFYLD